MMDMLIKQILHLFPERSDTKSVLYYYLAECNFKLRKYPESLKMIQEALKGNNLDSFDVRDWKI